MAKGKDFSGFLSSVFLYAVKKNNKEEKQAKESGGGVPWDTNEQYYNNFVENLFLHKSAGSKAVRLKDLFVMPRYEEIQHDGKGRNGDDAVGYISEFSGNALPEQRHQGEILFIEGDAGVGKTSLVSYLAFLYKERKEEWKQLFPDKMLLCVRLRDIIPEGMKFSSDTIVKDILRYLKLSSIEEFKRSYENPLIILDGFDELCMVEGINTNSNYYIYQIFKSFADYKVIITTRPQYLDVKRLDISRKHIVLQHFDALQRKKWVEKYRETGILEYEEEGIGYILDEGNAEIDSICDTPMIMYMIVAGGIDEEAKHNEWVLYHQIFYKELSDTEYNSMFFNGDGIYNHGIKKYQELLYRLSTEISYRMFCSSNMKLFLTDQDISQIVRDMEIEDIKLMKVVRRCYALCNYWKSNGKGAVEFYHNNIRDFFLCEKIFYEFNAIYHECELFDTEKMVTYINGQIYNLFRHMKIPSKVMEFIYLRSKHNYEHYKETDFPAKEYENGYLRHFFSDMLQYGGVSHYDRNSGENVYDNMINVLANTARIFGISLDPYLASDECLTWFNDVDCINQARILRHNFYEIFTYNQIDIYSEKTCLLRNVNCEELVLSAVCLFMVDLSCVNLKNANLSYADLRYANLNNANLYRAILRHVKLSDADLRFASLKHADLKNADLRHADLRCADLSYADLSYVDLSCADLRDTKLMNAILPNGFTSDNQAIQIAHLKEMNMPGLKID